MTLQTQVNFATLSETQRIELCKQYDIDPNDTNAEVKINDIFTEAEKNKGAAKAEVATNEAHKAFEDYEAARGKRIAANNKYITSVFTAQQKGQSTDTSEIRTVYNNLTASQKSEHDLDIQHDILAGRALDACFQRMG